MTYIYRVHAVQRMFERDILEQDVEDTIENGEIIEEYPEDEPFPSYLALKFCNKKALHVVFAKDKENGKIIVITAYYPDKEKWDENFKKRRRET